VSGCGGAEGGAAWGQPCVTGTVFFGLRPSTFGCIVVLPTAASVALLMSLLSRHFCAALLALFAATASGGLALAADILCWRSSRMRVRHNPWRAATSVGLSGWSGLTRL